MSLDPDQPPVLLPAQVDPDVSTVPPAFDHAPAIDAFDPAAPLPEAGGPASLQAPPGPVLALLQVALVSGFPTQVLIMNLFAALGLGHTPQDFMTPRLLAGVEIADAGVVIALVVVFLAAGGERPGRVFFGTRSRLGEATLGLVLTPILFAIVAGALVALQRFAPALHNVQTNPLGVFFDTRVHAAIFLFVVIFAGGVREELQRAFILHRFAQRLGGAYVGLVISSVAFGAEHYIQGDDTAIAIGLLGLVWGVIYIRRRSAIAPMVSHAAFDALNVIVPMLAMGGR